MLLVWSAQQAFVRLQNIEMALPIVEGKAYQLTSSNREVSFFFYIFSLFVVIFIIYTRQ